MIMKRILISIGLLIILTLLLLPADVKGEEFSELFVVKFNPTGTHVKDEKLKVRLDFYPTFKAKSYQSQYVYVKETDTWRINPSFCWFVSIDDKTSLDDLESFVITKLDSNTLSTIDEYIVKDNSLHYISPLLRNKNVLSNKRFDDTISLVAINSKLDSLDIRGVSIDVKDEIIPNSIDVGHEAIITGDGINTDRYTVVVVDNKANANGNIDTVETFYTTFNGNNLRVATFYIVSGANLSTRDYEDLGVVATGSKQTFVGLDMDIEENDMIGCRSFPSGQQTTICRHGSEGDGYYLYDGEMIPSDNQLFTLYSPRFVSLYGTGEEEEEEIQFIPRIILFTTQQMLAYLED